MKSFQRFVLCTLAMLLLVGTSIHAQQKNETKSETYIIIQKNGGDEKVINNLEEVLIEFDIKGNDKEVVEDFMRGRSHISSKPFLGVYSSNNQNGKGIVIDRIVNNSAAQRAGLQNGDIITKVNSTEINSVQNLIYELKQHQVGDVVNINYIRNGQATQMEVELSAKQTRTHRTYSYTYDSRVDRDPCKVFIGVFNTAHYNERGVKVTSVIDDTPASEAQLLAGDYITALDGVNVKSHRQLLAERNKHNPGDKFMITYTRNGVSYEVEAQFKSCDDQKQETPIVEKIEEAPIVDNPVITPSNNSLQVAGMEAYPNPTYGDLNLKFQAEAKPTTIRIVDIQGRIVHSETLNNFDGDYNRLLDLSNGTPGILTISITQEGKVFTKSIVLLARA